LDENEGIYDRDGRQHEGGMVVFENSNDFTTEESD
tara:strand:- start:2769 stop:2873 length:105 start_codon:yes stop_codon:yes gene_type:complete